ncbi:MAG: SDR family NAD(P)-dependent oxidoreductase [Archangium sp.]|nr:SDR family NAD(P)-dependent oxidoreductase [Archangium sp.]
MLTDTDLFVESSQSSSPTSFALVTGASAGIGFELATQLVASGHGVILVGDDATQLQATADVLRAVGDRPRVEVLQADLSRLDEAQRVHDRANALGDVEILVNNAVATWGATGVSTLDLSAERVMLQRNVISTVELTQLFVVDMLRRGQGKILFTASVPTQAAPSLVPVCDAAEAFLYSFATGIRNELADLGITVTVLVPDLSEYVEGQSIIVERVAAADELTDIARAGYQALIRGEAWSVTPVPARFEPTSVLAVQAPVG